MTRRLLHLLPKPADPTPEEIQQRCLEIQRGWDEREEARRRGVRVADLGHDAYEIPQGVDGGMMR